MTRRKENKGISKNEKNDLRLSCCKYSKVARTYLLPRWLHFLFALLAVKVFHSSFIASRFMTIRTIQLATDNAGAFHSGLSAHSCATRA